MPLVTTVVHPTVASDLATVDAASNGKHANAPPLPTQISYTLLPTMPTQNSYVPTPALPTQSSHESPLAMSRENSYTPTVMPTEGSYVPPQVILTPSTHVRSAVGETMQVALELIKAVQQNREANSTESTALESGNVSLSDSDAHSAGIPMMMPPPSTQSPYPPVMSADLFAPTPVIPAQSQPLNPPAMSTSSQASYVPPPALPTQSSYVPIAMSTNGQSSSVPQPVMPTEHGVYVSEPTVLYAEEDELQRAEQPTSFVIR